MLYFDLELCCTGHKMILNYLAYNKNDSCFYYTLICSVHYTKCIQAMSSNYIQSKPLLNY